MNDLSDTFIKALPDLTLVVRRDALIMSNLGGRELGVAARPGSLRGKRLNDLWPADVADDLSNLIRRCLKGRSETDGHFDLEQCQVHVRVRPQGVDRVLMVMRAIRGEGRGSCESSGEDPATTHDRNDRAHFARKFRDALAKARLRESRVALAVVHFSDLPGIVNTLGAAFGRMLVLGALERLSSLNLSFTHGSSKPLPMAQLESDQLAVLIEDVPGHAEAARAAEHIRLALVDPIDLDGHRLESIPIIGLALFPTDGHEPETLLDRARGAILEAHRNGRQSTVATCSDPETTQSMSNSDLEQELRWAVEREQFSLEYAPIVELQCRRTVALAASLQWTHPACGPIAHSRFMPALDKLALRHLLDRWTFRRGFRDLAHLTEQGSPRVNLAVTLTRQSMNATALLEDMTAAAVANDICLSRLDINIDVKTLGAGNRVREQLRELRERGARIFLEDFGDDGIALARLGSLPLDGGRIAESLVDRIDRNVAARTICSAATSVARAFGLVCIATGVSRRAQLDSLYECGCEQATGPLFGLPKPVAALRLKAAADAPVAKTLDPVREA